MRPISSIFGDEEIKKILNDIAPKHANNLMRTTVHRVASRIAKKAKLDAPKRTGILKKGIKAKRRRSKPGYPVSDVIVKSSKGRKSAFYWRFIEYGTSGETAQEARPFITPIVNQTKADFTNIIKEEFGVALEKALAREAKKLQKT